MRAQSALRFSTYAVNDLLWSSKGTSTLSNTPNPPPVPPPASPAPQEPTAKPNRARTLWLAIGIPVGVILLAIVAVAVLAWMRLHFTDNVDATATLDGATSVTVNAPNASLNFIPGTDDQVHVTMAGTYSGPTPTLETRIVDGVAQIATNCSDRWLARCNLTLNITLPASVDITARGMNGHITLNNLTGDIRLHTTNGNIDVTGTRGRLDLVNVNGHIRVQDAASATVSAETVNGAVELDFTAAPWDVTATSVNGAITVRVPDDGSSYAVSATTVLGKVDTGKVRTDPDASRTVSAETVNGSITVGTVSGK